MASKADNEESTSASIDEDAAGVHSALNPPDKRHTSLPSRSLPKTVTREARQRVMDALQGLWEVDPKSSPIYQSSKAFTSVFVMLHRI